MNTQAHNNAIGAALTVMASAFAAGTTLLAKALGTGYLGDLPIGPPMHAFQISNGRFIFALIAVGLAVAITRPKLTGPNLPLHVIRSFLGWGGVTMLFAAAAFIPLADATAISFLNPVFAMIFAVVFLREIAGPVRWASVAIAFCGAVVLARPGAGVLETGALIALGAAVLLGAEITILKRLSGGEKPIQILLVNNAVGVVLSSVVASFVWIAPTPEQWAALAAIGILMASAQFCFTNALARADASFATPFFYTILIFSAVYDLVVFDVIPDSVSVAGSALILCGAALLAWRETRARR